MPVSHNTAAQRADAVEKCYGVLGRSRQIAAKSQAAQVPHHEVLRGMSL
ncbi:hypothetical protein ABZ935_01965 [Streptomyces coeruleorubidus]